MSIKFWRRLAGCIAIECLTAVAGTPEYRAGAAAVGHVRAVALEDRRGARAVFAETDFAISRAVSDWVAVKLVKEHGLDRSGIVINGTADGAPDAGAVLSAVEQALSKLDAAAVSFDGAISVRRLNGSCLATLYPVRLGSGCREGATVRGPLRAAFQMIDVPHGLQTREVEARAYPVQAVAIGRLATVLALGGDVPPGRFATAGRIVVPFANDTWAMPEDSSIEVAIAAVLKRVR